MHAQASALGLLGQAVHIFAQPCVLDLCMV